VKLLKSDALQLDSAFMFDYFTYNNGLIMFKNDLKIDDNMNVSIADGGSDFYKLMRLCSVT